jgi:UDP-glucose 4-epimerase
VHALEHVVKADLPGVYNVAGDGVLALSEVAGLLGKPYAPVLPPWGTGLATAILRRVGIDVPAEALNQLRFGRGVDNRRYKAAGFRYGFTSREAVLKLGEHLRLHPVLRGAQEPYRYEREVDEFLRWSPHVKNGRRRDRILGRDRIAQLERVQAERLNVAEQRIEHAERTAQEAVERAKEAERRAAQAAQELAERRLREPDPAEPRAPGESRV